MALSEPWGGVEDELSRDVLPTESETRLGVAVGVLRLRDAHRPLRPQLDLGRETAHAAGAIAFADLVVERFGRRRMLDELYASHQRSHCRNRGRILGVPAILGKAG